MLWKILIILLSLEAFGIITPFPVETAIHFLTFLILAAIVIRICKWLFAANSDLEQLLKLSIYTT